MVIDRGLKHGGEGSSGSMPFKLSFSQEDGWFSVACQGEVSTFEEFSEKARTVLAEIVQSGCKRVFLDDRRLALNLGAHDIILIAAQLEKADIQSMGLRLASLHRPEDRDIYATIETIYQNRSIMLRRFDSKSDAVEWLKS